MSKSRATIIITPSKNFLERILIAINFVITGKIKADALEFFKQLNKAIERDYVPKKS